MYIYKIASDFISRYLKTKKRVHMKNTFVQLLQPLIKAKKKLIAVAIRSYMHRIKMQMPASPLETLYVEWLLISRISVDYYSRHPFASSVYKLATTQVVFTSYTA